MYFHTGRIRAVHVGDIVISTNRPWVLTGLKSQALKVSGPKGEYITQRNISKYIKDREVIIADCHLIAAAPEMYEALEDFVEKYTAMINSGDCGFWNPEEEPQVIAARLALSKARGET